MTHARQVFRNTVILGIARVIERATGLVIALVISRELGASSLGVYATVVAYFGLIAIAGDGGAVNLLIRELSKDRSRTSSYVAHTTTMAVVFSLCVMAIAWLVIPHLGYDADLRHGLELIVLAVLPGTMNSIQEAVFVSHARLEFQTITTFFGSIVLVVASVVLIHTGHGVISLVVAFVTVEYAVTIVYFLLINRYIARLRYEFKRAVAAEILREMKAFAGSSVLAGLFARPEILILSLVGSVTQVGFFSAALKLVEPLQFISTVYMTNVYPVLSRAFDVRDGRARQIQDAATRTLLALSLPACAGLFVLAPEIVHALYGPRFGAAAVLVRIMALNFALVSMHDLLWRVLAARGEQGRMLRIQLVSTVIRLGGGVALIEAFHAKGAAVAVTVSLLLHDVLLARGIRRDGTRVSLARLSWKFAGAAALMGAAAYLLRDAVSLLIIVPAAACVYLLLVVALRAVTTDEVATLRTLVRPRARSTDSSA